MFKNISTIEDIQLVITNLRELQSMFDINNKEEMILLITKKFELNIKLEKDKHLIMKLYSTMLDNSESTKKHLILVDKMEKENELLEEELKKLKANVKRLKNN